MLTHERRILASVIDVAVVLVISLLINLFIPNNIYTSDLTFYLVYMGVGFIYMFLSLLISKDSTIGLYSMSLKLLSTEFEKPNMKIIVLRSLANGIPALYLVNILHMLLNKTSETYFDILTNSVIVKTGATFNIENSKENNR